VSGAQPNHVTGNTPDRTGWPPEDIRRITDALGDGLLIADGTGHILYVNPAGEELLGWENSKLVTKPFDVLVGRKYDDPDKHFGDLITHDPLGLIGKRLDVTLVRGDGKDVRVDLMLSVGVSRAGGSVVIAVIRAHDAGQFQRLSTLTRQLLDVLTASEGMSPVEELLDVLGRRLGWDVTALWGLEPDGSLVCRGVWTTPDAPATAFVEEKRLHPDHDSGDLAKLALERGEPLWFTDLGSNDRFTSEAIRTDGLTSACAFPIQYAGHYLGAVKMMSRAQRGPDPDLVELIAAASGHIGEILHALEQTAERERLLAELEETRQRLQFLLRANRIVSNATGYVDTLERLAEVAVPTLGDLCLIDVLDDSGQIRRLASRHADPTKKHLADELKGRYAPDPQGGHPSAEVMTTGISRWSAEMTDEFLRATTHDARHFTILKELGFTSYMTVPLQIDGHARGTVTLVSAGSGRRYSMRELKGAEELASQIAGVVERARVLDRELHISHTLQHSLLPDRLPDIHGLEVAARYVPAAIDVEVGGDWYDVIPLDNGAAALVVGDVQGHDMVAASVMGQLRHALSLLLSEGTPPAEALRRLNRFLTTSNVQHIATVLIAVVEPESGTLRMSSAGHPSPVALGRKGARSVPVTPGPPLGVRTALYQDEYGVLDDETIVLFTDGLIERRGRHPDTGLRLLLRTMEGASDLSPHRVVDVALAGLMDAESGADDVVMLAARRAP
jgi:serine/threonine-protein kinase RsbW